MAKKRYTEEYKKHLLDLVREGRSPEQLAQEYEPSIGAPTHGAAEHL